ncbi:MAG: hypothetical protein WCH83_05890 [Alphaproteobacteria bacterium]|jgi:hypothetical protein
MAEDFVIPIEIDSVDRLFATIDLSPFHDRSFNAIASDYVIGEAQQAPKKANFVVSLRLPAGYAAAEDLEKVRAVVAHHFHRLAVTEDQEFRNLLREGVRALAVGMIVLAVCTALAQSIDARSLPEGFATWLRDGLSVFGWIANWRPAEILFYDWWPVRQSRDLYRRLEQARIEAVSNAAAV